MRADKFEEFYLFRIVDVSGISGTGVIARGVRFPSGKCVLEWQTFHSSLCIYQNLSDVESIHGHEGKTQLIIGIPPIDLPEEKKIKRKRGSNA